MDYIPLDFLAFEEEPLSIAPRFVSSNLPRHYDLGLKRYENKWYVGKAVQIIGRHHYKGATGKIKYAYPNGQCQVELNIYNHCQLVDVKLSNIRVMYVPFLFGE